jgi:uncharacterized membrane protein
MTSPSLRLTVIATILGAMAMLAHLTAAPLPSRAPTVTTIDYPGALHTRIGSINAAGEMAGTYVMTGLTRGFVLDRDGFRSIHVPGAAGTQAQGINAAGEVSGLYTPGPHGFLLKDGAFHLIEPPGALSSTATGINAAADLVGNYRSPDGLVHGYVLSNGTFHTIDVPGATLTVASDINEQGDIVGRYQNAPGPFYSMFHRSRDGAFSSIDVPGALSTGLPGTRAGINPKGEIVGPYLGQDGKIRGFVLSAGRFTTIDFPDTASVLAQGINPEGTIVGYYRDLSGRDRGFVLRH